VEIMLKMKKRDEKNSKCHIFDSFSSYAFDFIYVRLVRTHQIREGVSSGVKSFWCKKAHWAQREKTTERRFMMDPTVRFSSRVENYVKYRPHYPQQVIAALQAECGLVSSSLVADIGSGAGALTELFLSNGNCVLAVEPNREMRDAAEHLLRKYPGFRSIAARAEATTLDEKSVDFVVVGQAFHWFDLRETRGEFFRILKPSGWVMVVWNEREFQTTPFLIAYDQLLQRHAPDYSRVQHKRVYDAALADFYGTCGFAARIFSYRQELDYAGVKGRLLSSSYTPEPGDHNYGPTRSMAG
jgi:SAM-dependent methyltransferase